MPSDIRKRLQDVMLLSGYSGTLKKNFIPPYKYRCLVKYFFAKMCRTTLTRTTDGQRVIKKTADNQTSSDKTLAAESRRTFSSLTFNKRILTILNTIKFKNEGELCLYNFPFELSNHPILLKLCDLII